MQSTIDATIYVRWFYLVQLLERQNVLQNAQ